MKVGRLARTLARLHPLQIAARGPNALLARVVWDVPSALAPRMIDDWPAPQEALRRLANNERLRGAERLARLPAGRLQEYESCYGLELGADESVPLADWRSHVAVEPFPASVRARRLAVAIRCGRRGLDRELARAARAVLVRPELHLLGNHLLENGFALASAGAAARGAEADVWWSAGLRLLAWQLPAQFLSDGGHVERSASYHLALTAALLETIAVAEASGRRVPEAWREVAARALGWLAAVRTPDGTYPLFNDSALDAAPVIDDVRELGDALAICAERVVTLDATGWLRLECEGACAFVDAGPDAQGWQPGHAHADGLTFELWVHGRRAIVDFGVASYGLGALRDETRATRSHNTVELAGIDSSEVWGGFRVGRRGRGRVVRREGTTLAELEHDGYAWRPGRPHHVRRMVLRPGCLEVHDRVEAGEGVAVSRLRLDATGSLDVTGSTDVRPHEDRWYPRHGDARPAKVLEQRFRAGDPRGVVWRIAFAQGA